MNIPQVSVLTIKDIQRECFALHTAQGLPSAVAIVEYHLSVLNRVHERGLTQVPWDAAAAFEVMGPISSLVASPFVSRDRDVDPSRPDLRRLGGILLQGYCQIAGADQVSACEMEVIIAFLRRDMTTAMKRWRDRQAEATVIPFPVELQRVAHH